MRRPLGYVLLILFLLICINTGSSASQKFVKNTESSTGSIYGYTYQLVGWQAKPVSLVMVKVDDNYKLTNVNGYYEFRFLAIGKTYDISVAKIFFMPQYYQVTLTSDNPSVRVDFLLEYRDIFSSQPMISIFA